MTTKHTLTPVQLRVLRTLEMVGQGTAANREVPTYLTLRRHGLIIICNYALMGNPFYTLTAKGKAALEAVGKEA